ncbi:MAG: sugar phosphate nucleotidyltransferase, partial [Pseudomonadota bacterium]
MKAIILCAGYGTRLKPITDTVPKPMIKILGTPLLEYTINLLYQYGVREFYINRFHLPEQFEKVSFPKKVKTRM